MGDGIRLIQEKLYGSMTAYGVQRTVEKEGSSWLKLNTG